MIALTLIVCLHAAPSQCKPEPVSFDGSLMSCALFGQAVAAEWIAAHPKWRLAKFTCGIAGRQRSA